MIPEFPLPRVFIRTRYSTTLAAKELMEAMRSLAYSPNRFPFFDEPYIPCNKYHKMFIKNWYLILYQIEDDTVYVDYILDCRKEYNWIIR